MAEEVLGYKDLFDPTDRGILDQAGESLGRAEAAYKSFSDVVTKESGRIKRSQKGLADELLRLDKVLSGVNVVTRAGQEEILKLATQVEAGRQKYTELKTAAQGVTRTQKETNDSVLALKSSLEKQAKAFEQLQKAGDGEGLRQQALRIRETRAGLDDLTRALRGSTSSFTAAEGSYRSLQKETNRLNEELLNLGGTFSKTGQQTASQAAREAELKNQIAANTQKLKDYDSQLNRHWRNVGNYAGSIVEAVNQLRAERRELLEQETALKRAERATRGDTAAQQDFAAALAKTQAQLRTNATQLNQLGGGGPTLVGSAIQAAKSNLKSFVLTTAAATIGFSALAAGTRQVIENNNEYSDQLTDVRKTTGLTAEAAEELGEHLRGLSTRTTLAGLLDIAKVGGQLGRTGAEIEGFTDSIDILAQALSDDFGGNIEQIATEVGKIQTVFRSQFDGDIAKNLLAIGSAVNELAADGAATAPQMTDVALRVGAVAANAKLGLAPVLAYAAVLEELGYTAEVSGTTLTRVIAGLAKSPSKFFAIAKIADANLTLKQFVKLINTDIEGAFNLFLKGLNQGGKTTVQFNQLIDQLGFKGSNAASVLTSLAKNTDIVRLRQAAATEQLASGNSVMEESTLKNNNAAASWAKLGNSISNFFVSGQGANFSQGLAKFLQNTLDGAADPNVQFQKQLAAKLKPITDELKGYTDILDAGTAARGAQELAERVNILSDRFTVLNGITNRTGAENAELATLTETLRHTLGASVVDVDSETKAFKINSDALAAAAKARAAEATAAARAIAVKVDAMEKAQLKLQTLAAAERGSAQTLGVGIPRPVLKSAPQIAAKVAAVEKSAPEDRYKVANEFGVRPEQLASIVAYDTATKNASKSAREAAAYNTRLEAGIRQLALLGYDTAAKRAKLLEGANVDLKGSEDDLLLTEKERLKQEKDLADAISRRAASEYELKKSRLERKEGTLKRAGSDESNDEPTRAKALADAAGVRKKLAELEATEQERIARESAKKQFTTKEELSNRLILISETYKAKLLEVDKELTEEQRKLHNDALAAMQAVEESRLGAEQSRLQAIANNSANSYAQREGAQNQFYANEKALAQLAFDAEIRAANGSAAKIALAKQNLKNALESIRAEEKFFDADKANQESEGFFMRASASLETLRNRQRGPRSKSIAPGATDLPVDTKVDPGAAPYAELDLNNIKNYEQAKFEIENGYRKARLDNLANDATKTNEYTQEKLDYEVWYRGEQERLAQDAIARTAERLAQIGELASAGVGVYTASLDAQMAGLEKQKANELKVVGNNEKEKSKIEARYAAEQAKLRRKKAIAERVLAIFQIAANTAISVAKSVADSPLTFGLPWSAVNAGIGALQIAAVLAQPLPTYAKGTASAPRSGPALVGEAGPELLQEPGGRERYVPAPRIVYLKKGTRVLTNAQTKRELSRRRDATKQEARRDAQDVPAAYNAGREEIGGLRAGQDVESLTRAVADSLAPAVAAITAAANRPTSTSIINMDERGFTHYLIEAGNRAQKLDARYRRKI